jgi:tetratricopeptide (TPR) repeat protein
MISLSVIVLWVPCILLAQIPPSSPDSLVRAIRTAPSDTAKLRAMIALSEQIYTENPDTNKIICRAAQTLADQGLAQPGISPALRSALLKYKATAINNLAASYYMFGDLDSALACFHAAQTIHATNGYLPGVADALNNEGLILGIMGRYAEQRDRLFQAMDIYAHAGDSSAMAKALNNIATYYKEQGQPDSAMLCFGRTLAIYKVLGDKKGIADTQMNIGEALSEQGRAAEAMGHYLASKRSYENLDDRRGLSICLGNLSSLLQDQGLLKEALEYAHQSLDLKIALGDSIGQAKERMDIGQILEGQDEHDLALNQYTKSMVVFVRSGDRSNEAMVQGSMGDALRNMGYPNSALVHYRRSMAISEAIGKPADIANALYKLGHYFEQQGQLDSALVNYRACLVIDERTKDRESESFTLFSIGHVKLLQGNAQEAERWARRSLKLARELGFPNNILRATEVLHQALEQQGKWREAVEVLKLHQAMVDSVRGTETAKALLRMQLRYSFRQTQIADSLQGAVALARVENERQAASAKADRMALRNKALIAIAIILLVGGGTTFVLDRRRRRAKYQRDAAKLELKAMRAQMNPHFIFNALASINDFVADNEGELASSYLTKFARLMRLVLENSRQAQVPLAKDLEALKLYLDLEQLRMNGKFEHAIELDPAIDQERTLVPPLVIQPFVENAIRHGLAMKSGKGHLLVTLRKHQGTLVATVQDDGVGLRQSSTHDGNVARSPLGTTITAERLAMLNGKLNTHFGYRFLEVPQGVCVEVTLPCSDMA